MAEGGIDGDIFEHAPVGLLYTEDRIMRRLNRRFADIFGYDVMDLSDRSLAMLYPSPDEFDDTGQRWTRQLARHGSHADDRIMRRADGELFWCRVSGQTFDRHSPLSRAVWSFTDLSPERPVVTLTRRERQVGMLLVEGLTAKEIALRLGISPRTVHVHKNRLMTRFGVRNSLELVRRLTSMPS